MSVGGIQPVAAAVRRGGAVLPVAALARPLLRRPWLWHFDRRNVALGAFIGVSFGFLIPVLQP